MILITGGVKAGKSRFALKLARSYRRRAFIATGVPFDEEMKRRIERHKKERGDDFTTFEEPVKIWEVIREIKSSYDVIVVECLTTWLGNLYHYGIDVGNAISRLIDSLSGKEIIVTNEVGLGVVPADKATRNYVETLAALNARLAAMADEVYFVISGLELKIK